MAIVNAELIVSLMHLNIGVSRALINQRDEGLETSKNKMKTASLQQEILYHLSPSTSTQNSLEIMGIRNISQAFFVVVINGSEETKAHIKSEIESASNNG